MPKIGSILNTPLETIEKAITAAETERTNILRLQDELVVALKKQDDRIKGYRHAYEVLLKESNTI